MKKTIVSQINKANFIIAEILSIVSSVKEDISNSNSITDIWNKIDRMYKDIETLRNMQTATGSKSFSILENDVEGHTKYLQGIDVPIMVNTVLDDTENLQPTNVCEMHIENVNGKPTLIITPEVISI